MIELHFEGKRWKLWKNGKNNLVTGHSALKMFLELLLTLLLPSADSLMVTMQVSFHKQLSWKAKNTLFRFPYKHYHSYFSQTAASQTTQASSSGETDSFSQSSLSASASGESQLGCKLCIFWFWFWSDSKFSINFSFNFLTCRQVPTTRRARDEKLVVQLQCAHQQWQAQPT